MNTGYDALYLCICALKDKKPSIDRVCGMNLTELYSFCEAHKITALVSYSLESVISLPEDFSQARTKAIRKNMLFDAELRKISSFLKEREIAYLPLKGTVLKSYYPKIGMRQMSDVDILYDAKRRESIKEFMLRNGYTCTAQGDGQDAYKRDPVYNFEFHHLLFSKAESKVLYDYYREIEKKLSRQKDDPFRYAMRDEDFYVFHIAHEYKHFSSYGTGVRSLLDEIVLLDRFKDNYDREYIKNELEKIGLAQFEKKQRELVQKLMLEDFEEKLTKDESELLRYFMSGGVYGDYTTGIVNRLTGEVGQKDRKLTFLKKIRYVFRRVFPPLEYYRVRYPFFYKYKMLIPFCVIYRLFMLAFRRNDFVRAELRTLGKKHS